FLTIWFAQLYAQVYAVKRRIGSPDRHFDDDTLADVARGRAGGVRPLFRSLMNVNGYIRSLAGFHETHDLFLTPTLAKPPLALGALPSPRARQRAARVVARTRAGKLLAVSGMLDQIIDENIGWVPY